MKIPDFDEKAMITSFSSTKRQILIILKREGETDLSSLAELLNLTKMGVLNHIQDLEELGIIERFQKKGGVGRPKLYVQLSKTASDIFPKAYSSITCSMLNYIADKLGRNAVYDALKHRQKEVFGDYKTHLSGDFNERLTQFSQIRDHDGYMVELKTLPGDNVYELLEYNCPILSVADIYDEACSIEEELFSDLLDANVKTTHRTVAGDKVCRFLIRKK